MRNRLAGMFQITLDNSYVLFHSCSNLSFQWHSSGRIHSMGFAHPAVLGYKEGSNFWNFLSLPDDTQVGARNAIYSTLSVASIFLPFVYHQYTGYVAFCTSVNRPDWCNESLPLIYSHVQSHYWNGGLFRYWTFQQIPNFLLAAPSLALILAFSLYHLKNVCLGRNDSPFLNPSITPHAIHAFITSCILLFASHTQIVLRQSAAMPFTYWAAAWLLVQYPTIGRWWVAWSVVWGLFSTLLWASFLPPA